MILSFTGKVVHGEKRGRELGFPTANLDVQTVFDLKPGIYATKVCRPLDDTCYMGAASYGYNPTFGVNQQTFEVHLLDFDGDLYGEDLAVDVLYYLRDELKFDSVQSLVDQIGVDCKQVRNLLKD